MNWIKVSESNSSTLLDRGCQEMPFWRRWHLSKAKGASGGKKASIIWSRECMACWEKGKQQNILQWWGFCSVPETILHGSRLKQGIELAGTLCVQKWVWGCLSEHVNFRFRPDPPVGTQFWEVLCMGTKTADGVSNLLGYFQLSRSQSVTPSFKMHLEEVLVVSWETEEKGELAAFKDSLVSLIPPSEQLWPTGYQLFLVG